MKKKLWKFTAVILWILIWYLVSLLVNRELYVPSPYSTLKALIQLMSDKVFYTSVIFTMIRIIVGFLVAAVAAFILGIIAGLNEKAEILISPFITVVRSTPVMSFIILTIIWFSYNLAPFVVNIIMCFPPIYDSVVKGIRSTDRKLLEMSKIYKVSFFNTFKGIYFGSVKPFLYSGMNTSLGLSFRVAVAAEVFANPKYGIGTKLLQAKVNLETTDVYAWTFVILLLSFLSEQLFKLIIKESRKHAKHKEFN
ncbi:MAG: ABC transporter permease subunit [Clostridia bacterium]